MPSEDDILFDDGFGASSMCFFRFLNEVFDGGELSWLEVFPQFDESFNEQLSTHLQVQGLSRPITTS